MFPFPSTEKSWDLWVKESSVGFVSSNQRQIMRYTVWGAACHRRHTLDLPPTQKQWKVEV